MTVRQRSLEEAESLHFKEGFVADRLICCASAPKQASDAEAMHIYSLFISGNLICRAGAAQYPLLRPETRKRFILRSDRCVQLGAQVALPVREFNMARGTYAFRGVIVYLMLSIRCACASREPGVIVSCCACALHCPPPVGRHVFKEAFALHKSLL